MTHHEKARHVSHTADITLHAPPEKVFPLFGAVREAEWAEGWNPEILYSESPLAEEEGAVFVTHGHGEAETIWVVTRFEPENFRVEYARITPGAAAVRVLIRCEAAPGDQTTAHVTYQITALGDGAASAYEDHYPEMMAHWESAINHALAGRDTINTLHHD